MIKALIAAALGAVWILFSCPAASSCPRCGAGCSPAPPPAWPAAPHLMKGGWVRSGSSWMVGHRQCRQPTAASAANAAPHSPVQRMQQGAAPLRPAHAAGAKGQHTQRSAAQRTRRLDLLGRLVLVAGHRHLLLQLLHLQEGGKKEGRRNGEWTHERRVSLAPFDNTDAAQLAALCNAAAHTHTAPPPRVHGTCLSTALHCAAPTRVAASASRLPSFSSSFAASSTPLRQHKNASMATQVSNPAGAGKEAGRNR